MEITSSGERPARRGAEEWFAGDVWLDGVSAPGADVRVVVVTFAPGARTAWHTHPHGQSLRVVSGVGRAQSLGGPVREIRPGDSVWFAPGEVHWHGAAPGHVMVHVAVQRCDAEGRDAAWLNHVTDEEYRAPVSPGD
jgi:quercetin dioxygenase-like cupin family protein